MDDLIHVKHWWVPVLIYWICVIVAIGILQRVLGG